MPPQRSCRSSFSASGYAPIRGRARGELFWSERRASLANYRITRGRRPPGDPERSPDRDRASRVTRSGRLSLLALVLVLLAGPLESPPPTGTVEVRPYGERLWA